MSDGQKLEISEEHIGNPDILFPIEELIERALEIYEPGKYGKAHFKTDPATAKDRHRKKALTGFPKKNVFFLGQLLLGVNSYLDISSFPITPLKSVLKDLGFELDQYEEIVKTDPERRNTLLAPSFRFAGESGWYERSSPFADKSREEIGNALKVMFQIDAPIPEPGDLPDRSKIFAVKAAHNSPTVETQDIKIALSERWFLQASKVYQPAMLEQFLTAIGDDPYIQAEIGAAKNAAIRGEELQHRETKADEINMLAFDSTPLQSGLKALFGDASEPLADLVDRNLRARSSQIQEKARFIMDQQVIAAFSPKR